ncbi:5-methyltetrahydropteroyltriglutamate--homocysteine S-methyltransferase [Cohnella faecalis]|uniref:5-methyltetrahydropteroyltriglutamate--homocysteine methyltransferase n=1 Tax=Cohnella faecalis TaxID=2315694 RepID=A0A398CUU4_9BACL|nr:5-methyltetrahydropteroyltriglutamate--homocysteine S-methyltransferase [Cohnella faecalis]RIE03637.1 5-methyltetrahydropteroyltriglutamate--homocysteine S-methyltransferase [Cohnella faecalis]
MANVLTAGLGYPRIGEQREWKKGLEQFWAGKQDEEAFRKEMRELRIRRLLRMKESGVALLPSGDFTLYDSMLDHIAAFDLVPERFRKFGASDSLAVYFAMARGKEGAPACEMTKWFDTNYHYLVPELASKPQPRLAFNPWRDAFLEAKEEAGLTTRPVLIGPYTFVRLAKGVAKGEFANVVRSYIAVYNAVLAELAQAGAEWAQLDEPSLVTDVPEEHLALLHEIYDGLKTANPGLKLHLQTYFGSVEHAESVFALPVDGIGLDFVRGGEENLKAVKTVGWSTGKKLGAGVVDGRGIWRVDPDRALTVLEALAALVPAGDLIVQPSCSLLHVPVTSKVETSGDPVVRESLAFADEKLQEIVSLAEAFEARLSGNGAAALPARLEENRTALEALRNHPGRQRAAQAATADASSARAAFAQRHVLQRERFKLPLLPTTTIGSLPQTAEVRKARLDWRRGKLSENDYRSLINGLIETWIRRQEELGIDVLVHGEFERTDMVEHFAHLLDGYYFTSNGWVQSYGSRCVKPPVIFGDVVDRGPMTVAETVYAQSLTDRPVKGMLTGPITMLAWSFYRDDLSRREIAEQIARALDAEVLRLEAAGIGMIQVDEPALREIAPLKKSEWPAYLDWAVEAFRTSVSGVRNETQIHTHMCYCDYHEIIDAVEAMDADVISLETSRSHGSLITALHDQPYGNGIGLGVYDIHSPVVPEVSTMLDVIRDSLAVVPADRLWVNPDCGLKTRGEPETIAALQRMTEAAALARQSLQ